MFKQITFLILILITQKLTATNFYEQLCDFNPNWKKYENQAPKGNEIQFKSDNDLVQAHLKAVLKVLRNNPVDHLSTKQYRSRIHLISVLNKYQKEGLFPQNYYREERIPVFIDEHNTHCAVGYLLEQTGYENVAKRIAKKNNYAWVFEIDDPALPIWQKSSGFTLEEIKLIQGAYDFYMPYGLTAVNRFEIPQKPDCLTLYFEDEISIKEAHTKKNRIWCLGEGKNGVLNGRWIQNYSYKYPWIVGFFDKGKRSGQWKEYYQGTNQLCRTEVWRNDKLNGIRRRFDRQGNLIEEIFFKDGNAIKKTNHSFHSSRTWTRTPIDSNLLWTEVYSFDGALIANGYEKTNNPGNLQWFQDIELTALNTFAITSRSIEQGNNSDVDLYMSSTLVEYDKVGEWTYYKEYSPIRSTILDTSSSQKMIEDYGFLLQNLVGRYYQILENFEMKTDYDSIVVDYNDVLATIIKGYGEDNYFHLEMDFTIPIFYVHNFNYSYSLKEVRQYNKNMEKVGLWKYYNLYNQLYKTVQYVLPEKETEIVSEN